jgi:hypothetical protein
MKMIQAFNEAREAFYLRDAATFNRASAELAGGRRARNPAVLAGMEVLALALGYEAGAVSGRRLDIPDFGLHLSGVLSDRSAAVRHAGRIGAGHGRCAARRGAGDPWALAGRNPVSNLFESAMFIIAGMTLFSLIISAYYRTRVVGLGGAALGAFFTGMANNMPLQYGEKILPLIDALQSYWLNIHVTAMLVSYSLFASAFFVALAYLGRLMIMRRRPGFDPGHR